MAEGHTGGWVSSNTGLCPLTDARKTGHTDEVPEARRDGRIYLRTKSRMEVEGISDNVGKVVHVKWSTETYYKTISWRKR